MTPLSTVGGFDSVWSRGGTGLHYLEGQNMMVVSVPSDEHTKWGLSEKLFELDFRPGPATISLSHYDVASDGRFIMVCPGIETEPQETAPELPSCSTASKNSDGSRRWRESKMGLTTQNAWR